MNYQQTIDYLFSAMPSFQRVGGDAYKPGLERIESFCCEIGSPHLSYRVIHIAGTNGKGSTSHMIASVLQSAGYRVGLFTSPHLKDFRERVRINGVMIDEQSVVGFVERHRAAMERVGLSFFEMTAALAFDHFASERVDIALIETGLGGRLDATNIVTPELSVITNIDIDHTQYLGSSRAAIAAEKAGIIKRGVPVVLGERGDDYTFVIESKAREMCSELTIAEDCRQVIGVEETTDHQRIFISSGESYDLDLVGEYQRRNIITALAALDHIEGVDDAVIADGLSKVATNTSLMGRWHCLGRSPLVICDTGHNPHGLKEIARQLSRQKYDRLYCVLGFAADKDVASVLPLFPPNAHYIFTQAGIERALPAPQIAPIADSLSLSYELTGSVAEAVACAKRYATPDDMIYIGGSTFVVAELDL